MRKAVIAGATARPNGSYRAAPGRLLAFASGDFAFNLYWQSVSLFLLFFYTDVLGLPAELAGMVYMIGVLWDGLSDLAVGILAQRRTLSYRRFLVWGSIPLGFAFVMLYLPTRLDAAMLAAVSLLGQISFRTLYALVNVPYSAWSARLSVDSRDRTTLAGMRMLFGAVAAVLVALGTPWIVTRSTVPLDGYLIAAALSAACAAPLLIAVARTAPEALPEQRDRIQPSLRECWRTLAGNRAFVTLNLAAAAAGMAAGLLNQSVLYYFKHVVGMAATGPPALAMMGVAGTLSIPLWMAAIRQAGVRRVWGLAAAIGVATVMSFALSTGGSGAALALLITLQVVFTGLNLGFWAMLPDTVEYGEWQHGVRVEAMAFGVSALVQKLALSAAAGAFGLVYARIGYLSGGVQSTETIAGIRWTMLAAPALGLAVSAIVMAGNPLRRGVHAAIVRTLANRG